MSGQQTYCWLSHLKMVLLDKPPCMSVRIADGIGEFWISPPLFLIKLCFTFRLLYNTWFSLHTVRSWHLLFWWYSSRSYSHYTIQALYEYWILVFKRLIVAFCHTSRRYLCPLSKKMQIVNHVPHAVLINSIKLPATPSLPFGNLQ